MINVFSVDGQVCCKYIQSVLEILHLNLTFPNTINCISCYIVLLCVACRKKYFKPTIHYLKQSDKKMKEKCEALKVRACAKNRLPWGSQVFPEIHHLKTHRHPVHFVVPRKAQRPIFNWVTTNVLTFQLLWYTILS